MSRIEILYKENVKKSLKDHFKYSNIMMVPELKKVVISMGLAAIIKDKNALQDVVSEITILSGQKPVMLAAKKSISNFKIRSGQIVGLKVTLRRKRMYDFFDRFCNIVAPRIRDFRGFPLKGDGKGSYSIGLEDQQMFPEINLDKVKRAQGMNITFVTSAKTDDEFRELFRQLGFPFKKNRGNNNVSS